MSTEPLQSPNVKRTFWTVTFFYVLITFEFLYMASPFAAYFYSIYLPGLDFINSYTWLSWLSAVYLPHIVTETASTLVNWHNIVGGVLFVCGLLAFCISAGQVYYYKLTRKGAVTGGIYKFIRHPQYVALAVWGLGMLFLWPRFIVLMSYVTMLFAYYALANFEEQECAQKFGQDYTKYKAQTRMFIPFSIPLWDRLPALPKSGIKKFAVLMVLYISALGIAFVFASSLRSWVVQNLYALYEDKAVYISVGKEDAERLRRIAQTALSSQNIQARLYNEPLDEYQYINYIMPAGWYVSEIPMNPVPGVPTGHHYPSDHNFDKYKIIFTKVISSSNSNATGKDILFSAIKRIPVVEVWVDLKQAKVTKIMNPPVSIRYKNVPVPLY